eukprot:TRINITY_DN9268_c0_g3_i2.p1 TRINITY_DN9268_c0_g3~~TRINITY_DN9268_c0_g3_i2.p1  ORF type:complete len:509 (-),score=105.64 TRINITY_DN9268_c0_g3_i2:88-1614(-)
MAERRTGRTANKLAVADPANDDVPVERSPPMPTRNWTGASSPLEPAPPLPFNLEVVAGSRQPAASSQKPTEGGIDADSAELIARITALEEEMASMRKRQEVTSQRQEEAETIRRGQIDCISERVYEAEKTQRNVQERTDEAIEKARVAFQKTAADMEHERSNLMCVITQVNQNFEHLSGELAQVSEELSRLSGTVLQTQQEIAQLHEDRQLDFSTDIHHLEQRVMEIEQLMPSFDEEKLMSDVQKLIADRTAEFRRMVGESQVQSRMFAEQFSEFRSEVSMQLEEINKIGKISSAASASKRDGPWRMGPAEAMARWNMSGQATGSAKHPFEDKQGDMTAIPPSNRDAPTANTWLNGDSSGMTGPQGLSNEDFGLFSEPQQSSAPHASSAARLSAPIRNLRMTQPGGGENAGFTEYFREMPPPPRLRQQDVRESVVIPGLPPDLDDWHDAHPEQSQQAQLSADDLQWLTRQRLINAGFGRRPAHHEAAPLPDPLRGSAGATGGQGMFMH